jgi:hypothetical protein
MTIKVVSYNAMSEIVTTIDMLSNRGLKGWRWGSSLSLPDPHPFKPLCLVTYGRNSKMDNRGNPGNLEHRLICHGTPLSSKKKMEAKNILSQ